MSSNRAARALASAERAITQPAPEDEDAASENNEPPQPIVGMTNTDKYKDPLQFSSMLKRIGLSRACRNQLEADDFDTMETVVNQYKDSIKSFETYLKSVNKSINNVANPVQFSPIITDRLLSVIHHFIQAVSCFHTMANIELITRDVLMELIEPYRFYKRNKTEEADNEVLISLPDLKGHKNWISYWDKFLSNLDNLPGSNGTPLAYVVDATPRTVTRRNQQFIETQTINQDTLDTYTKRMIHFDLILKRTMPKFGKS